MTASKPRVHGVLPLRRRLSCGRAGSKAPQQTCGILAWPPLPLSVCEVAARAGVHVDKVAGLNVPAEEMATRLTLASSSVPHFCLWPGKVGCGPAPVNMMMEIY